MEVGPQDPVALRNCSFAFQPQDVLRNLCSEEQWPKSPPYSLHHSLGAYSSQEFLPVVILARSTGSKQIWGTTAGEPAQRTVLSPWASSGDAGQLLCSSTVLFRRTFPVLDFHKSSVPSSSTDTPVTFSKSLSPGPAKVARSLRLTGIHGTWAPTCCWGSASPLDEYKGILTPIPCLPSVL